MPSDGAALVAAWGEALAGPGGQQDTRPRVGAMALAAQTVDEHERRDIIGARLPSVEWPQRRLIVTAVNAATGELVLLDSSAGVGPLDAVAASGAVDGQLWRPPYEGSGRHCRDPTTESGDVRHPAATVALGGELLGELDAPGEGAPDAG